MAEPPLRVERVFKRFGGLLAVDDVSLAVEAGRITALIGPNGAGKTTLFSIISGFLPPSEGRILHRGHLSRRSRAEALDAAAEVASTVGLGDLLGRPAASLTVAGRKRLEVARALAAEPELLLLDEVLAGLNPAEIATMVPIIRGIAHSGVTILMTEHVMQAVMSLAEYVFVLAEGRIIAEGAPQVVVGNPRVVEAYLGHGAAARLSAAGGAHV